MRAQVDEVFATLIERDLQDPDLGQRTDILSLLLQARYEDGSAMTRSEISDELLSLLVAGHETTATSAAWALERLRREPALREELVAEVDAGRTELLQAVIYEVLRTRPIIEAVSRKVSAPSIRLGEWVIPRDHTVVVNISLAHLNESSFPNASVFDPSRFGAAPDMYAWLPFGGGTRRCPRAAFANLELQVVLRTILREFSLETTSEPVERIVNNGLVSGPADGGRIVVHRRSQT